MVSVEMLCLMLMSMTFHLLNSANRGQGCSKQLSVFSAPRNPLQDYNQAFIYKPPGLQWNDLVFISKSLVCVILCVYVNTHRVYT